MKLYSNIIILLLLTSTFTIKSHAQTNEKKDRRNLEKTLAYEDSLIKVMHWKPIKHGLSISKFGDIGFKTSYIVSRENVTTYRTSFGCCNEGKPFKDIIDIATFKQIGGDWAWGGYFKDKNHIYHYFGNSGGGNFYIVDEVDNATFEIINNCYGRDKNHVYDMRFGLMDNIDPNNFKILPNGGICIAKYNNVYYRNNEQLDAEAMKDPAIKKAIKELDKYIQKTKLPRN